MQCQSTLRVSSPRDPAEREAETTARKIMRMAAPEVSVGSGEGGGGPGDVPQRRRLESPYLARFSDSIRLMRQHAAAPSIARRGEGQPQAGANIAAEIAQSQSAGAPLPTGVRKFMEPRFGADFSNVRIHTGEKSERLSRQVSAQAFTVGNQIFFGRNQFRPETPEGRELIAHELTHTIQQGAAVQGGARVQRSEDVTVTEQSPPQVQRLGISDALGYFADAANALPGFRMFTIVLGVNPINMSRVDRSAANILRAIVEFLPGGALITRALDNYGVFDRVGGWIEQQLGTLGLSGRTIRDSINRFLDSLSLSDVFNLGGVWERAKRIFTEPIDRIIRFARSLFGAILGFIKDAILRPIAELVSRTRGWDLLCAVLGVNPITGDAVPRTAETLIGGFMKLIGQEEIWENIKRGNAIARAWAWFQGALSGLMGFVRQIPQRFIQAVQALEIEDLVALPRAFARVAGVFGSFIGSFLSWAGNAAWDLLEIIFTVVAPSVMVYLRRAAGALRTILRNPVAFVGYLVRAAMLGFRQFASRFLTHLRGSLIGWLTGALSGANLYIPQGLNLREIIKFVLSVLGLTWQNIRQKLVRVVGEPAMRALETGFELVMTLVTQGPAAAWEKLQESLANLREMVMEQIMTFVQERVVTAAVTRLLSMLTPAGAFIQAIIATYNTVMFFVERLRQIAQVATSFIDSIAAIAAGNIASAANRVEQTMGGLLTLVISFLARLAGLGRVSDAVTNVINRVRQPIDRALDRVVEWIVAQARRLGRLVAQAGLPQDPAQRLRLGMQAAVAAVRRLAAGRVTRAMIDHVLAAVRLRYGFRTLTPLLEAGIWHVEGEINPKTKLTTEVVENLLEEAKRQFPTTFRAGDLRAFLQNRGKIGETSANGLMASWDGTVLFVHRSRQGDTRPLMSFNRDLIPTEARETARGEQPNRTDEEKIRSYRPIVERVLGSDFAVRYDTITRADEYRSRMRADIVSKYRNDLPGLNSVFERGIIPPEHNRIKGDIFELWCEQNLGVSRPGPIFVLSDAEKIKEFKRQEIRADGAIGNALVDAKVRTATATPSRDDIRQMSAYAYIITQPTNKVIDSQANVIYPGPFRSVIYIFNDPNLIPRWEGVLKERIGEGRVTVR
jgi:hypothetical protein